MLACCQPLIFAFINFAKTLHAISFGFGPDIERQWPSFSCLYINSAHIVSRPKLPKFAETTLLLIPVLFFHSNWDDPLVQCCYQQQLLRFVLTAFVAHIHNKLKAIRSYHQCCLISHTIAPLSDRALCTRTALLFFIKTHHRHTVTAVDRRSCSSVTRHRSCNTIIVLISSSSVE